MRSGVVLCTTAGATCHVLAAAGLTHDSECPMCSFLCTLMTHAHTYTRTHAHTHTHTHTHTQLYLYLHHCLKQVTWSPLSRRHSQTERPNWKVHWMWSSQLKPSHVHTHTRTHTCTRTHTYTLYSKLTICRLLCPWPTYSKWPSYRKVCSTSVNTHDVHDIHTSVHTSAACHTRRGIFSVRMSPRECFCRS